MTVKLVAVFLISILCVSNVFAENVKEIILKDGSVIYGNIVGVENANYQIQTKDMGIVLIAEEKVITIKSKPEGKGVTNQDVRNLQISASEPTDSNAVKAGIDALKRSMQNDPGTMTSIGNLQNDPDFMAVLNDSEIMSAVESGDINTLTSNPKFMKLLSHSVIRGAKSKVK